MKTARSSVTPLQKCEVPAMFFISKKAFNKAVDKAVWETQHRDALERHVFDQEQKLIELTDRVGRLEHVVLRAKRKAGKRC